jgi:hypothetical protein
MMQSTLRPFVCSAAGLTLLLVAGCVEPAGRINAWLADDLADIRADTAPAYESNVYSAQRGTLTLQSALNQTVACQLVLRAVRPAGQRLDVRVSPLTSPTGDSIGVANITRYCARYTRIADLPAWFPPHTGQNATPKLVPDILVPWEAPTGGGPITLSADRNEIVWLDITVPPTTTPGRYTGRLTVAAVGQDNPLFACDIALDVVPVAIPGRRSLPVICRIDPRPLLEAHLRWPTEQAAQTRLLPDSGSHSTALAIVNHTMRLFQAHRTNPVLWASFPKLRPVGERDLDVNWADYDAVVSRWLDGSAFQDRVPLAWWPVPVAQDYPPPQNYGGPNGPQYARVLANYLDACYEHFEERGWLERAFFRPVPPGALNEISLGRLGRLASILRQSEAPLPLVAHVPARSLRGLGWSTAPEIRLPDVQIWAPRAMWYEPDAMQASRQFNHQTWFIPDRPPYAATLASGAPATDPASLPWQAHRYQASALWLEDAAAIGRPSESARVPPTHASPEALVYAGAEYGLRNQGPVPSIRLKRLRRGLYDYEILKLLELNGGRLLAAEMSEQIVPWACTEAGMENLLSTLPAGWPKDPLVLRRARRLLLQDLANRFAPSEAGTQARAASMAEWSLMFNLAERIQPGVVGIRLEEGSAGVRAEVRTRIVNASTRSVQGAWQMPNPPPGWQLNEPPALSVAPHTRVQSSFAINLLGMEYNVDGVYPFDVIFDTPDLGAFAVPARLAVAVCPALSSAPHVDGRLDDWPLAANNAAGDFQLCWQSRTSDASTKPSLPTQAFFGQHADTLYIAIRCAQSATSPPHWQTDNRIPVEGGVPWEQDLVEVLIDPRPTSTGTSSDLYCLQIKPSGMLSARHGCRTEPPVGTSVPWQCNATVAVTQTPQAWVVELAVPLEALGSQHRRTNLWGINILRLDARRGEYSSWSGARGFTYLPTKLGNLIMLWP